VARVAPQIPFVLRILPGTTARNLMQVVTDLDAPWEVWEQPWNTSHTRPCTAPAPSLVYPPSAVNDPYIALVSPYRLLLHNPARGYAGRRPAESSIIYLLAIQYRRGFAWLQGRHKMRVSLVSMPGLTWLDAGCRSTCRNMSSCYLSGLGQPVS